MKTYLNRSTKIIAIKSLLENYPEAFEGRSEVLATKDSFISNAILLAEKINQLIIPYKADVIDRIESRSDFANQLVRINSIGILLARHKKDSSMLVTFQSFAKNRYVSVNSGLAMVEYASAVFSENQELAVQVGVTAEELTVLDNLKQVFKAAATEAAQKLEARRALHLDINSLIHQCNQLLRNELDIYIRFQQLLYPQLALNYKRIRFKQRRKNNPQLIAEADISGQVTDAATGEPIANANISLIEHTYVLQTDKDGNYLFDELPENTYTLSCHAVGYLVPQEAKLIVGKNESVIWNFALSPVSS